MKICPKCRYLDHEDNGPNYECPMCGVIYSRVIDKINEEKIIYNEQLFEKKWARIKRNPEKALSAFWIWAGLMAVVAIVSGINIQKSIQKADIPADKNLNESHSDIKDKFQTKFEMRTTDIADCPFKVISNNAPNTIFLLLDQQTKEIKVLVYVNKDDEIELKVPAGDYDFQMIQGEIWLGEKEHFGFGTVYLDGQKTLTFTKTEKGTTGNVVKIKSIAGNMKTIRRSRINI